MNKSKTQTRNPSFSSSLLDEIYNSIDDTKTQKTRSFVGSINTTKKQSIVARSVPDRRIQRDRFFGGSVSSSSDSNSSIFSSSDTEVTHSKKTSSSSSRPLCFGPSKPRKKTEYKDKALFHQNRVYDDYDYTTRDRKGSVTHKKPKTPASPAGRIVHYINSLFNKQPTTTVKSYPRKTSYDDSVFFKKPDDYHHHPSSTTCSSASSFSRSCLNKSSEKSYDCIKRSVTFCPVDKASIYAAAEEEVCGNGNVRKSVKKYVEDGGRRSVEEIAREFLRDYRKNHGRSLVKNNGLEDYDEEDEDEDDVASDSSSDLFELDLVGRHHNVYGDELPVYETTFATLIS